MTELDLLRVEHGILVSTLDWLGADKDHVREDLQYIFGVVEAIRAVRKVMLANGEAGEAEGEYD